MNSTLYNAFKTALLILLAAPTILAAQENRIEQAQQQQFETAYAMSVTTGAAAKPGLASALKHPEPEQTSPGQNQPDPESEASCNPALAAEVSKVIEKNYKVGHADALNIENKFGKVHINTWKQDQIHVKVTIICRAGTDQKAQELLDKIRIVESRDGKNINFRTQLEPVRINNSNQQGFEINYTVSMPEENPLTIQNSFGDVYLADFKGKTALTVKYGSLKTEQLNNVSNMLKVAYGSANCRFINQGDIDLSYGSMNVEGTNGLKGAVKYSDFKIGTLSNSLDLNMKYGSLKVDHISKNVSRVNLESGFSPIALRFEDKTTFNFDVNVQFGSFKFDKEQVTLTSMEKSHTSSAYKGNFGSATPKSTVSIVSKYGDVRFTR